MAAPSDFDPFAPETVQCPHAFFRALRDEAPVYPLPGGQWTVVSRAEDVRRVALDTETFSSNLVGVLVSGEGGPTLLQMPAGGPRPVDVLALADPPVHTRQRKLVHRAFAPRRVARLEPGIRQLARSLVEALPTDGEADFVEAVAVPLPVLVICDLLGLPREDAEKLRRWSDAGVALLSGLATASEVGRHSMQLAELGGYLTARFEEAAEAPGDDVLGDLVRATRGGEESLSAEEAVHVMVQLLIAGHETTASLVVAAAHRLATDRDLAVRLRVEPAHIPAFLEEVLRLESPFYGHYRVVRRRTELAGATLEPGTRVMLLWGAANRDERAFGDPERLSLDRANPRGHLSFGHGPHYCLGAELARLEARVAVETLLGLRSRFALACPADAVRHVPSLFVRRLEALPLRFGP